MWVRCVGIYIFWESQDRQNTKHELNAQTMPLCWRYYCRFTPSVALLVDVACFCFSSDDSSFCQTQARFQFCAFSCTHLIICCEHGAHENSERCVRKRSVCVCLFDGGSSGGCALRSLRSIGINSNRLCVFAHEIVYS